MMANQGWVAGSGLGRNGDGRAEPINVEMRTEKKGLGAMGSKAVVDVGEGDWRDRGKQRRYEELREGIVLAYMWESSECNLICYTWCMQ